MGADFFVTCSTCRVTHCCGYGSYYSAPWRTAWAKAHHPGHDGVVEWTSDFFDYVGDDLAAETFLGRHETIIAEEKLFKRINDELEMGMEERKRLWNLWNTQHHGGNEQ